MNAAALAPKVYDAHCRAFDRTCVRWALLRDCERERWRIVAARVLAHEPIDRLDGRRMFDAWAYEINPKPWARLDREQRMRWTRMTWDVQDALMRDEGAA